jgi:hypothetical protein
MIRIIKESELSRPEIADMLVVAGFGNEEEGYLDYFLENNPKYVASVNLDDMGAYIDDYDTGEHIPLPFANGADRMILRTKEDVRAFLDYIYELDYDDIFESVKRRNSRRTMKESYGDTRYEGRSYYGTNFSGIEDDLYTDDFSELEDWTWEKVNKGGCVEVVDTATGNRARLVLPEDSEYYNYIDTQDCIIWSDKYGDRDEKDVSLYQCLSESKKRSFDKKKQSKVSVKEAAGAPQQCTIGEFCEEVKRTYHKYFPDSMCVARMKNILGNSIFIDCFIAGDESEFPNGYAENDMFNIKFNIDTRDAKSVDDEFGIRTIECYSKSFYTAPPSRFLAYGRHDLQFRKTTGDARKIIAALDKFFKRLYDAVVMERDNDNIEKGHIDIVNRKIV